MPIGSVLKSRIRHACRYVACREVLLLTDRRVQDGPLPSVPHRLRRTRPRTVRRRASSGLNATTCPPSRSSGTDRGRPGAEVSRASALVETRAAFPPRSRFPDPVEHEHGALAPTGSDSARHGRSRFRRPALGTGPAPLDGPRRRHPVPTEPMSRHTSTTTSTACPHPPFPPRTAYRPRLLPTAPS